MPKAKKRKTSGADLLYSFEDKEFLLSPKALPLRNLAESLYPAYLVRCHQEGKKLDAHPIPALDDDFVMSSEAIWFRVLCETIYTNKVLEEQNVQHTVLWFGSARWGTDVHDRKVKGAPNYVKQAQDLAERITRWSIEQGTDELPHPFTICTGGGPSIMEAGNRGAEKADGRSIGLNIGLPFEQTDNPHISKELSFNFRYFFTRKFHFLRRAKAAVCFPGGFGTMDELFETLTLIQTNKMDPIHIILYGEKFWKDIVNMERLVDYGTISEKDLDLFEYHDSVDSAFDALVKVLGPLL